MFTPSQCLVPLVEFMYLVFTPRPVPRTSGGVYVRCIYTQASSSYLWWNLYILCLHPGQRLVPLVEFMYLVFTPRPAPRTSGGVYVSCVYIQANASYLWWSLCILCLHPGQCLVPLVEFMYLVFTPRTMPRTTWWSLCILCSQPGQCLVPLMEFMYLVFTTRPMPRTSGGVYVSYVYTQANASYLWWSLLSCHAR